MPNYTGRDLDSASFYLIAFFTGIVVLPATGGVGLALIFGSAACPIAALIKLIAEMLGYDVPISLFDIGSFHMPLALGCILAVILGVLLLFVGKYILKLARRYITWIVSLKHTMLGHQEENQ